MGFWQSGGFFSSVRGHVVKWWQQVILPVLHINNDQWRKRKENQQIIYSKKPEKESLVTDDRAEQKSIAGIQNEQPDDLELARQKAEQMQREEEERRQKEIERVRREADEQAQIASIMNANKVDVDAFIKAGKASRNVETDKTEDRKKQEDMERAQEILERLNREATEDEAKKLAEIEAAKQKAKETFG